MMVSAGKRILIVEDQRLIAADLENTLKKLGYQTVANAAEGKEAVEKAVGLSPDLVLMDIRLRGSMDGIEAAEAIRAQVDIPIVYLTAYADEETILRAKMSSPFAYVVKPFNERELRAAIEVALYRQEAERLLVGERARRQSAEEFKLLVATVKDYAIFMLDATGRVASWNAGAMRIKGYSSEEILGKHFSVFYPPEDITSGRPAKALEQTLKEGRVALEGWRLRKDGSHFWANVVITAIRDEAGKLHGFGKVTRDLTERRRAEGEKEHLVAELKEAVRSRDEFLQVASHELKTPLTPLQLQLHNLSRLLQQAGVQNEELFAKLEAATRQTRRFGRLIDGLLDVSRIIAGRLKIEPEPVDLSELLRDVVERFRAEARRVGPEITVDIDEAVSGRWDRLCVEQILSNLIANAIKYGAGKPIEICSRLRDGIVRVAVTDRGIGIEKEALERIFGRFQRAVSARNFGGLGLGLFIARQFAEAHGGSIVVHSEPGAGSTFTLVLPREAVPGQRC